jgi:hypothetical protein
MSQFQIFFRLGLQHILDLYRIEAILFLVALTVVFLIRDWKQVILLVVFFTLGYSLSYYLTFYEVMRTDQRLIDFLRYFTVFITAVSNVLRKKDAFHIKGNLQRNFFLAVLFGMVYGIGFAEYLKAMVADVRPLSEPLLAFNLGIEAGLFIVVIAWLLISFIFISLVGINRRDWVLVISSGIAGASLTLLFEAKFW